MYSMILKEGLTLVYKQITEVLLWIFFLTHHFNNVYHIWLTK